MDDTRIALLSLGLLVVVLAIIIGSLVLVPSFTALLATLLAWANLAYLVGITFTRCFSRVGAAGMGMPSPPLRQQSVLRKAFLDRNGPTRYPAREFDAQGPPP